MLKRQSIRALTLLSAVAASATLANAAELPPIKITDANTVMSCATPGRLMAYLKSNNPNIQDKFDGIATDYMRHGEALAIRWDYAFFQMLVETGYLKFTGDVDVKQNNFAGLGATGKGAKGESFPDVSTGVKAHLQHVLMYTGSPVEDPVAQRTRDVQAWGVLTKWQQTIKRPMTFKDLTSKWAPTSKAYPRDIVSVAERFEKGICQQDDPQPELVAEARGGADAGGTPNRAAEKKAKQAAAAEDSETPSVAAGDADAKPAGKPPVAADATGVKVLNQPEAAPAGDDAAGSNDAAPAAESTTATPPAKMPTAEMAPPAKDGKKQAAAGKALAEKAPPADKKMETAAVSPGPGPAPAATAAKCKVWQASYGGSKAIIIKAQADKMTNYTVLDVNDGAEKREAEAYIAAYAKGGATVGEFASSTQALEKAFQLCPEG
ncbi:MAG: glucosaminidase domain-containing protein [Hyphomicrobiaceae bacterium]|nr:glucosaminidase domain-containing protein [Hyphomicrobiaceae bacterium]